jgi:hypothetical protein
MSCSMGGGPGSCADVEGPLRFISRKEVGCVKGQDGKKVKDDEYSKVG